MFVEIYTFSLQAISMNTILLRIFAPRRNILIKIVKVSYLKAVKTFKRKRDGHIVQFRIDAYNILCTINLAIVLFGSVHPDQN